MILFINFYSAIYITLRIITYVTFDFIKSNEVLKQKIDEMNSTVYNNYTVNLIAENLKTHDRILVVMGSEHAVTQEPALISIFEQ